MTDANYKSMTDDEFREILEEIVDEASAAEILSHGDVYTELAEIYNNAVLDRWAEEYPERAFPAETEITERSKERA